MSLITVSTVKGAPGGTSIALLLAAAIARRHVGRSDSGPTCLLAECDRSGGDLGPRLGLPGVPGLASLALAARHGLEADMLPAHTQTVEHLPGVGLLLGIAGPEQGFALGWMLDSLVGVLCEIRLRCVVDLGRLGPEAAANLSFRKRAVANLLVTTDQVPSLLHTRAAVESAAAEGAPLQLVVTGERRHPLSKIGHITGAGVLGSVRLDRRLVASALGPRGTGWTPATGVSAGIGWTSMTAWAPSTRRRLPRSPGGYEGWNDVMRLAERLETDLGSNRELSAT